MIYYFSKCIKRISIIISISLCSLFCICSSDLKAQIEDEERTYQLWLDYHAKYHVSRKFKVYGDVGYRKISPNIWTRYYIRPALSYFHSLPLKSGKHIIITYHLGLGAFFTNATDTPNIMEIRPFQGIDIQWPTFKRLQINHYVRLEEQFYFENDNGDFNLRVRYMLSGIFHWNRENWKTLNSFYMPFNVEYFWDLLNDSPASDVIRVPRG